MNSLRQIQTLVSQGKDVLTIGTDSVPLIPADMPNQEIHAVNFLRCGCPAVQVLAIAHNEVGKTTNEVARGMAKNYEKNLLACTRPDEKFTVWTDAMWEDYGHCALWVFEFRRIPTVREPAQVLEL